MRRLNGSPLVRLKCRPMEVSWKICGCDPFKDIIFYAAESELASLTMTERLDTLQEESSSITP